MSKLLGIDIRPTVVRAALLRTSYRRMSLMGLNEVSRSHFETLEGAIRAAAEQFAHQHEAISVALEGHSAYIHRLTVPPAALKQVEQVLPFELEAQIPIDFDELVFDARVLPRSKGDDRVDVLAAAARTEEVASLIQLTERSLGHEPERVAVGPVVLGNLALLCAELRDRVVAVVDLGDDSSELAVISSGVTSFARTLSVGVGGLPGNANEIVAALRQSMAAWGGLSENSPEVIYICGGGAELYGMEAYLSAHVGVEVKHLPALDLDELKDEQRPLLSRYAKAIAVAAGLRAGSKDLDLRRGPLTYQRGYGFLKERVPLLVGLGAVTLVSFIFSAWAESRSLSHENEVLANAMATISKQVLGEEAYEPERVIELLDRGTAAEKDPQPEVDGFSLAVALAEHIPEEIEHDVDELDLTRNKVKLSGVVPTTSDAQRIAEVFKGVPCFNNVTISKISQVVKSDRQKYAMEFEYRCEEEKKKTDKTGEGEN